MLTCVTMNDWRFGRDQSAAAAVVVVETWFRKRRILLGWANC